MWKDGAMQTPSSTAGRRRWLGPFKRATWRDWLYLLGQLILIAGIEVSDDLVHALHPLGNAASGLANAVQVMDFEMDHGFWIEPGVQRFFEQTHYVLGQAIGWAQVVPVADAIYGQGHVLFTLSFALWMFFYRRALFPFLRNVFLLTTVLAVGLYEVFPLAPPRLAKGLKWDGHPVHIIDTTFNGVKIGFNEFAAMPSVHVAWALIVGGTVAWAARPLLIRLLGLVYPLIMATTVIVTGNHYVSDVLGAVVVVTIALACSLLIDRHCTGAQSLGQVLVRLQRLRHAGPESEPDTSLGLTTADQRAAA
jgi:membrane-associated phospholipid phosphatase